MSNEPEPEKQSLIDPEGIPTESAVLRRGYADLKARVAELEDRDAEGALRIALLVSQRDQLISNVNRYRAALERLSRKAPIGDYVADLYSDLCNPLLIEELDQRADFAREALRITDSVNA